MFNYEELFQLADPEKSEKGTNEGWQDPGITDQGTNEGWQDPGITGDGD